MKKIGSCVFLFSLLLGAYGQELTYSDLQGPNADCPKYLDLDIDPALIKGVWVAPEEWGSGRSVYYIPNDESYIAYTNPGWGWWSKEEIIPMDDNKNHFMDVKGLKQTSHDKDDVFGVAFWILPDGALKVFFDEMSSDIHEPVSF